MSLGCPGVTPPPHPAPHAPPQPGEAVVIYLAQGTTVVLTPGCCDGSGKYSTAVVVDGSIPIDFRTGDRPDRKGEGRGDREGGGAGGAGAGRGAGQWQCSVPVELGAGRR